MSVKNSSDSIAANCARTKINLQAHELNAAEFLNSASDVSVRGNIGLAGVNYRTCRVAGKMSNLRLGVHVCRP